MGEVFLKRGTVNITDEEARSELGESIVRTLEHLKNIAIHNDSFMLIHGTGIDNSFEILGDERGLIHYNNEYSSTLSSYNSPADFYNTGLINGRLPDAFIILIIPRNCFFKPAIGLWHSLVENPDTAELVLDETLAYSDIDAYSIPREYIFGFLDLEKKQIVQNSHFDIKYRNPKLIVDSHTLGSMCVCREEDMNKTVTEKHRL